MDGTLRETLGERLANRLTDRSRRRPRMALDASFYARFGLSDPWSEAELGPESTSSDGMVFLSGAPFYAMMRRLANARRRRDRRREQFLTRRAGTTMRAASRRWAGEAAAAEGLRPARFSRPSIEMMPLARAPEAAPVESAAPAAQPVRAPYQAMRPVASPWYTTPFVPARVVRGGAPAGEPRPMARAGERLQAAVADRSAPVEVAGQLPARARRAVSTVIVDALPADMPVVEVVRVLRRMGAPASVIREVVEFAPAAAVASVAARRSPVGASRAPGLRAVLSRSPAMALAASADADRAAAGTLAGADRAEARTGSVRPRAVPRATARVASRAAAPSAGAALSASPVSRVSAGRPVALRAVAPAAASAAGAGPGAASGPAGDRAVRRPGGAVAPVVDADAAGSNPASPAWVTRRVAGRFVPARDAGEPASFDAPIAATAHAVGRVEPAPRAAARAVSRFDGASWSYVRVAEPAPTDSVLPEAVPALRRAAVARGGSAVRPVRGTPDRFVPARVAAAMGTLTPSGAAPSAVRPGVARSVRRAVSPAAVARWDRGGLALALPVAGAAPVAQAAARMAADPGSASVVPHPTPRLDRPSRRARTLASSELVSAPPIAGPQLDAADAAAPTSVAARGASRAAVARSGAPSRRAPSSELGLDRAVTALPAARRADSPSRTAAVRASALRVAVSEVVRASALSEVAASSAAASGPMAWTPTPRFTVPAVPRRSGPRGVARSRAPVGALPAHGTLLAEGAVAPGTPVREVGGRFVSARAASKPAGARLAAVGAGRVDVVYVTPGSGAVAADAQGAPPSAPVRALAWASARRQVASASAYRGAIADGGLPAHERVAAEPGRVADTGRVVGRADGVDTGRVLGRTADAAREPGRGRVTRGDRAPVRAAPLSGSAFVAASPAASLGFGADEPAGPIASDSVAASPAPSVRPSSRPPLDRRLHALATGGADAEAPVWNARADGAPRVRSVHGLFESLARATTAEQVVHVLFARADGLISGPSALPSAVTAPIQQVIQDIRQEVARPAAPAATDAAALPTRASRLAAPQAEPLRPSRPSSGARVSRGVTRPVPVRSAAAGSEDRIMKLVKKLQGLIHLAEAENRLAEAQRQVRMAEDTAEARAEGGQGARPGGAAGAPDGSKVDIEQLGREVLDVVTRELEFRRERRMEDHDESVWW